ncbi:MAG: VCBS repeat-containing protein [Nodosilinea sp. WJT8-NPBG4]|jgi:hypothetical protein|nr:VCBS repeat-containing protein [Nodosilinea sp. WJT8-NPBG4]
MKVTVDQVKQYAPVVYFHEKEKFFPCGVEHLLQNSTLKDRNNPDWIVTSPTQQDLKQYNGSNYYVVISPSQFPGEPVGTAPMYYAIQVYQDAVQISYLMLYAYQGGQTCRALRAGTEFDCVVESLGMHQGDLERVVVTLVPNDQGTESYNVLRVGYEAHGNLSYYVTQHVLWEGGHPVINVALNGHSSQNMHVTDSRITEVEERGAVAITSLVSNSGQVVWRPHTTSEFKQLGLDSSSNPIGDQVWAAFKGRLGDSQENNLNSATYISGSNLDSADWTFVKMVDWAAQSLDKYDDSGILHGNGPTGPGDREWVTLGSGDLIDDGIITLQSTDNLGAGPDTAAWLIGDFNGDGKAEIVQAWKNDGGHLAFTMFARDANGNIVVWGGGVIIGAGTGAFAWFTGDFNGDGKAEIVQAWIQDGGNLAFTMFGSDANGNITWIGNGASLGAPGSNAFAWFTGDFNGDRKAEIVEAWIQDGGSLAFTMFGSDANGNITKIQDSENLGAPGSGAFAWFTSDFNGDGKTEIVEAWKDGDKLAFTMFGSDAKGKITKIQDSKNLGAGPDTAAWLIGDFKGDGKAEIVQAWKNDAGLAFTMFASDANGNITGVGSGANLGAGTDALAWFTGDFNSDGKAEIVQAWKDGRKLAFTMFGSDVNGNIKVIGGGANLGAGPDALAWFNSDFSGGDRDQIVQVWNNKSNLGLTLYGTI